jgi:hypothetical protein
MRGDKQMKFARRFLYGMAFCAVSIVVELVLLNRKETAAGITYIGWEMLIVPVAVVLSMFYVLTDWDRVWWKIKCIADSKVQGDYMYYSGRGWRRVG